MAESKYMNLCAGKPSLAHQNSPDDQGLFLHTEPSWCPVAPPPLNWVCLLRLQGTNLILSGLVLQMLKARKRATKTLLLSPLSFLCYTRDPNTCPATCAPSLCPTLRLDQGPYLSHFPVTQVKLWKQRPFLPP